MFAYVGAGMNAVTSLGQGQLNFSRTITIFSVLCLPNDKITPERTYCRSYKILKFPNICEVNNTSHKVMTSFPSSSSW